MEIMSPSEHLLAFEVSIEKIEYFLYGFIRCHEAGFVGHWVDRFARHPTRRINRYLMQVLEQQPQPVLA